MDRALIEEMAEAVGPEGFAAIVETFARDAAEQMQLLRLARLQSDFALTQRAAHKLRGQFAQLGLSGLADVFGRIEDHPASIDEERALSQVEHAAADGIAAIRRCCA